MLVQPYLFFEGRCEEAIEFYKSAIGAEVKTMMRFKEAPVPPPAGSPPSEKVMHAEFRIGDTTLMASDGHCQGSPKFAGFALTLVVKEQTEAQRLFAGLGVGGKVLMPLATTFYSPLFGMVTDRFGVMWMIYTTK